MITKLLPLVAFFLAGCSALNPSNNNDAGPPPVIDSLMLPTVAGVGSDGLYDLSGTISFHDSTATVSTLHVVSATFNTDAMLALQAAMSVTNGMITINFPVTIPSGTTGAYSVSVINSNGAESTAVTEMVTLE